MNFTDTMEVVQENCNTLHNISRWQADGNISFKTLEKVKAKRLVQKRKGKLRRREPSYVSKEKRLTAKYRK